MPEEVELLEQLKQLRNLKKVKAVMRMASMGTKFLSELIDEYVKQGMPSDEDDVFGPQEKRIKEEIEKAKIPKPTKSTPTINEKVSESVRSGIIKAQTPEHKRY